MISQTQSELLFEEFCRENSLRYERVPVSGIKTPDYCLCLDAMTIAVEVEQIDKLEGFNRSGVYSRTVGSHIRNKISEARKQIQAAAHEGLPAILLIYNTIDFLFGMEPFDFETAMYGELTAHVTNGKMGPLFHGREARLRYDANTSFSGVGHLWRDRDQVGITLYENIYARHPIPASALPSCIEVVCKSKK